MAMTTPGVDLSPRSFEESVWTNGKGEHRRVCHWRSPNRTSETALILAHGHGEHIGRYQFLASELTGLGMEIIGYDHRGHGKSTGPMGDGGTIDSLADDLVEIIPFLVEKTDTRRAVVVGHSMGGVVVARMLTTRRRPENVVGAILSAPAFLVVKDLWVHVKIVIGRIIAALRPKLRLQTGLHGEFISRDPDQVAAYLSDDLVHDYISAELGKSLIDDAFETTKHGERCDVPLLVYHGTSDRIASIEGTRRFVSRVAKPLLEYHELEGFYHEPHNEPSPYVEMVHEMLMSWIRKHKFNEE